MNHKYEVQRTSRGISVWIRDGIQSFSDKEAFKFADKVLELIENDNFPYFLFPFDLDFLNDGQDEEPLGSDW